MLFLKKTLELIRCLGVRLLRGRHLEQLRCPRCAESFAKLHLILADEIWDDIKTELISYNSGFIRRNLWAFCPACQISYDFPLRLRQFVVSELNDYVQELLRNSRNA